MPFVRGAAGLRASLHGLSRAAPSFTALVSAFVVLAGVCTVVAGCAGDRPAPAAGPAGSNDVLDWSLGEPVLTLGGGDGEDALHRASDVFAIDRDRFVVVNGGSNELIVFGADGSISARFGRSGEGPAEFSGLMGAWPAEGDSILAWDVPLRRLSWIATDGDGVRTQRLDLDDPHVIGRFTNGGLLALRLPAQARMRVGTSRVDTARVAILASGTLEVRDGPSLPSGTWHAVPSPVGAGALYLTTPYDPSARYAVADDGFFFTHGVEYTIDAYGADGAHRGSLGVALPPRALTAEMREAHLERWFARVSEAERPALRRHAGNVPLPEHVPAYDALVADAVGHLWARRFVDVLDPDAKWDVFTPAGAHLGVVVLPPGIRPARILADRVLAIVTDSLDVQTVAVFPLERNGQ